ncbi:MAG: thioredoxin domain-containing protein [Chloroflexota bacterium]|jgi:uncharacterized protein YyaL (SSP411 family)
MANRLAKETSPYLRQHADNPVDWYPWGEEALQKAKSEDKPIFLSIGYSACHWCHVMEDESFKNKRTASILNRLFVSIKVDREERPDLDQIYMDALQAMTGQGGWPMSLFLTPDGQPFFGGTYFPPKSRAGMPAFPDVLRAVADAWQNRRAEILESSRKLVDRLRGQAQATLNGSEETDLKAETLNGAVQSLLAEFDEQYGGWGNPPKFPHPMVLEFLLRYHHRTKNPEALSMASRTLESMARGGIYDQLGGGFHRYSVDDRWLVPHFEKMLYDNAQLVRVYLHAWQVTGEALFRSVAEETLDYVIREMTHPEGGFFSTQDADSEGVEGKYYLWTPGEIREILGRRAPSFLKAYGVTEHGNFEGKNVLSFEAALEKRQGFASARRKLLDARASRVRPNIDDKVLASWNGLMLGAFAEAARALNRDDYRAVAEANASFLLRHLRTPDGRLCHSWKDGAVRAGGYLEDYANLIDGLVELYQTTFDPVWFLAARSLAETMIQQFSAPTGFYDTAIGHEKLILRPRELQDNAVPSGSSMAAFGLLRLGGLAVQPTYQENARASIIPVQPLMERYPLGFGQWLIALDYALSRPREIAIVGEPHLAETRALIDAASSGYRPHQVVAASRPGVEATDVPLLEGRNLVDGRPAAYVCIDYSCRPPVTDPEALQALLTGVHSPER